MTGESEGMGKKSTLIYFKERPRHSLTETDEIQVEFDNSKSQTEYGSSVPGVLDPYSEGWINIYGH
jgi:hypothetical protein